MASRGTFGWSTKDSWSATKPRLDADHVEPMLVSLVLVVNALLCGLYFGSIIFLMLTGVV